jgi:hypothetical protein
MSVWKPVLNRTYPKSSLLDEEPPITSIFFRHEDDEGEKKIDPFAASFLFARFGLTLSWSLQRVSNIMPLPIPGSTGSYSIRYNTERGPCP